MLNEKKISKTGSITIPAHMRRDIGLEAGEKIKVETCENGIFLKRIVGSCVICGSNENLRKIDNKFICKSCREKIVSLEK